MVEVRLHGPLAKAFGMKWMLDINSPGEAIHAIEANRPGIRKMIRDLSRKGLVFRVRTKDHDYGNDDVHGSLGKAKRVDIIPIVRGAGAGVRFVIGAILVVVGAFVTVGSDGAATPFGKVLISAGISLMIGAVTEWLTPVPKEDQATENKQSWTLNGPTNTAEQGYPVPVLYGEVLTGGYPVSASVSASQVNVGGTLDPDVDMTGNRNPVLNWFLGTWYLNNELAYPSAMTMPLSALPINLSPPYTYEWSCVSTAGGHGHLVSMTMTDTDKATATIRIVMTQGATADQSVGIRKFAGNVSLTITGTEQDRSGTGAPQVLTRSRTIPVTMTMVARTNR